MFFGLTAVFIFCALVAGYFFVSKVDGGYKAKLLAVAQQTGLSYWSGAAAEKYQGLILGGNMRCYVRHALVDQQGISMGSADFSSRPDNQGIVPFNFVALNLTVPAPLHLVIDSRPNNQLGRSLSDAVSAGRQLQKLALEGNFPTDFTVYIEPGKEVEALTLLTPDVMAKLVDRLTTYDMELTGNQLYLYSMFAHNLDQPAVREQQVNDANTVKSLLKLS